MRPKPVAVVVVGLVAVVVPSGGVVKARLPRADSASKRAKANRLGHVLVAADTNSLLLMQHGLIASSLANYHSIIIKLISAEATPSVQIFLIRSGASKNRSHFLFEIRMEG